MMTKKEDFIKRYKELCNGKDPEEAFKNESITSFTRDINHYPELIPLFREAVKEASDPTKEVAVAGLKNLFPD